MFQKATKKDSRLRMTLTGPAGSGKTYSSLSIASHLGSKVAVIDTERGSASKYADIFTFDVVCLESFHPKKFVEAIKAAEEAGYDVLVIDSLSHEWNGKDGALEQVDNAARRSSSGNKFTAWGDVTPLHNEFMDAILRSKCHIITTMRSKMEYVMEKDEKGKTVINKVGLAPQQREGMEYEFDIVVNMDNNNNAIVTKTRCPALAGAVLNKPGKELALTLKGWLVGEKVEAPANTYSKEYVKSRLGSLAKTDLAKVKAAIEAVGFKAFDEVPADKYPELLSYLN